MWGPPVENSTSSHHEPKATGPQHGEFPSPSLGRGHFQRRLRGMRTRRKGSESRHRRTGSLDCWGPLRRGRWSKSKFSGQSWSKGRRGVRVRPLGVQVAPFPSTPTPELGLLAPLRALSPLRPGLRRLQIFPTALSPASSSARAVGTVGVVP